ncbi:MAG: hypothetical protein ACP5VP_10345 [Candidatus Limnocylindrales bacterium]
MTRDRLAALRAEADEERRAKTARLTSPKTPNGLRTRLGRALVAVGSALAGEADPGHRLP